MGFLYFFKKKLFSDFYPRWTVDQIGRGLHWDFFDRQGRDGFWVVGDGASFESTKSVMEYNALLLRQADLPSPYQPCYGPRSSYSNNPGYRTPVSWKAIFFLESNSF